MRIGGHPTSFPHTYVPPTWHCLQPRIGGSAPSLSTRVMADVGSADDGNTKIVRPYTLFYIKHTHTHIHARAHTHTLLR